MRMWIGVVSVLLLLFPACKQDVERQRILKVYGADWSEDGRVMVLGRFTDVRVTYGWLWGASYDTLKNQDVMLWIDPVSRAVDSVWVIHEPGGRIGGSDLWKDPQGNGWWVSSIISKRTLHYDPSFQSILHQINCGQSISFSLSGDTLYYFCATWGDPSADDTVKQLILSSGTENVLFTYPIITLLSVSPTGEIYFSASHKLLRWEGGDSFTVIDSPALYFGFKEDTLVVEKLIESGAEGFAGFVLYLQDQPVDTLRLEGTMSSGAIGNCFSLWKWKGNSAISCSEASITFCVPKQGEQGVMSCGYQIQDPSGLLD